LSGLGETEQKKNYGYIYFFFTFSSFKNYSTMRRGTFFFLKTLKSVMSILRAMCYENHMKYVHAHLNTYAIYSQKEKLKFGKHVRYQQESKTSFLREPQNAHFVFKKKQSLHVKKRYYFFVFTFGKNTPVIRTRLSKSTL